MSYSREHGGQDTAHCVNVIFSSTLPPLLICSRFCSFLESVSNNEQVPKGHLTDWKFMTVAEQPTLAESKAASRNARFCLLWAVIARLLPLSANRINALPATVKSLGMISNAPDFAR